MLPLVEFMFTVRFFWRQHFLQCLANIWKSLAYVACSHIYTVLFCQVSVIKRKLSSAVTFSIVAVIREHMHRFNFAQKGFFSFFFFLRVHTRVPSSVYCCCAALLLLLIFNLVLCGITYFICVDSNHIWMEATILKYKWCKDMSAVKVACWWKI